MKRNRIGKLLLAIVFAVICFESNAQINYKVHSIFLYKFTQYIEWPNSSTENFVIGVVGDSPIYSELESIAASKKVGERKIIVKKITENSDLSKLDMVFVSEKSSSKIATIAAKLEGKSTLIISESQGATKKGSGINFVLVEDKMKFEINKSFLEKQGFKVSGDLTRLGIITS